MQKPSVVPSAPEPGLAPLIAIVGCDGSGKSTVSAAILKWISIYGPSATAHLGQQSGDLGRAIGRLPLVGRMLDRKVTAKAMQARDKTKKVPDNLTAIVIYLFSRRRIGRFRRMLALRRRGVILVTDRYPQVEVPGFYDGPGLSAAAAPNRFIAWLARREAKAFAWMASYHPDLVIRLNVDLETAIARKPDHRPASLATKVAATPLLKFGGAPIVDLSASDPLPVVIAQARDAITDAFAARGMAPRTSAQMIVDAAAAAG